MHYSELYILNHCKNLYNYLTNKYIGTIIKFMYDDVTKHMQNILCLVIITDPGVLREHKGLYS